MPSSALTDKIARSPLRFGMIAGFLGVPLLWMAGDSLVQVVQGQGVLPAEAFWSYEASGALAGALLGGQSARIWASWRAGNLRDARLLALVTGVVGVAFYTAQAGFYAATSPTFLLDLVTRLLWLVLTHHLPFLLCLLFLVVGLFAPRK